MKTAIATTFCMLVIALPGMSQGADVFYLTNAVSHTNYGPFEYLHGGRVTIGDQTLEIRRLLTDQDPERHGGFRKTYARGAPTTGW